MRPIISIPAKIWIFLVFPLAPLTAVWLPMMCAGLLEVY